MHMNVIHKVKELEMIFINGFVLVKGKGRFHSEQL